MEGTSEQQPYMLLNLIISIAGVLIGGLITWLVARHYYKKASVELLHEANSLRRLNEIILHAMEDAGVVKLNRDGSFNIIGRIVDGDKPLPKDGVVLQKGDAIETRFE